MAQRFVDASHPKRHGHGRPINGAPMPRRLAKATHPGFPTVKAHPVVKFGHQFRHPLRTQPGRAKASALPLCNIIRQGRQETKRFPTSANTAPPSADQKPPIKHPQHPVGTGRRSFLGGHVVTAAAQPVAVAVKTSG
jgi:hypothetical protein